jgi:hypothetical protein
MFYGWHSLSSFPFVFTGAWVVSFVGSVVRGHYRSWAVPFVAAVAKLPCRPCLQSRTFFATLTQLRHGVKTHRVSFCPRCIGCPRLFHFTLATDGGNLCCEPVESQAPGSNASRCNVYPCSMLLGFSPTNSEDAMPLMRCYSCTHPHERSFCK